MMAKTKNDGRYVKAWVRFVNPEIANMPTCSNCKHSVIKIAPMSAS